MIRAAGAEYSLRGRETPEIVIYAYQEDAEMEGFEAWAELAAQRLAVELANRNGRRCRTRRCD